MMAIKKETAEQKLLKMIEASSGVAPVAKVSPKIVSKQSLLVLIKSINKILMIGLVVAALLLVNEIRVGLSLVSGKIQFSVNQKKSQKILGIETVMPAFQDVSFYLASVNQRNIFQPIETDKQKSIVEVSDTGRKISQVTRSLKLVGISWLSTVESASVMIEDIDKKVTYFLKKGDKIENISVKTIYADSAVLGYENEEITIKYDKSQ